MIKMVSFFNKAKDKVEVGLMDMHSAGDSSAKAGESVQTSHENNGFKNLRYSGQTTDSGGGGVFESLKYAMEKLHLIRTCEFRDLLHCGMYSPLSTTCGCNCLRQILWTWRY